MYARLAEVGIGRNCCNQAVRYVSKSSMRLASQVQREMHPVCLSLHVDIKEKLHAGWI